MCERPNESKPERETPDALAGATGAGAFKSCDARDEEHIKAAVAQAYDATRAMARALVILPASTAQLMVDAMLGAVDDVRARHGLDVLGYGEQPTRAELRASWRALDPARAEQPRRGRQAA